MDVRYFSSLYTVFCWVLVILFLVFGILKVTGTIVWSWWLVVSPLLLIISVPAILLLTILVLKVVIRVSDNRRKRS